MSEQADTISDELSRKFKDGTIFNSDDKELDGYLNHICSTAVLNSNVQHRALARCYTINTIKLFRYIDSIQKTNSIYSWIIIILTIVSITTSICLFIFR